jgi:hypothetical protein
MLVSGGFHCSLSYMNASGKKVPLLYYFVGGLTSRAQAHCVRIDDGWSVHRSQPREAFRRESSQREKKKVILYNKCGSRPPNDTLRHARMYTGRGIHTVQSTKVLM